MMESEYAGLTYHENAKLAVPGFAFQINSYDLHAGQVLTPSADVNCLTLMSAGEYAANTARLDYGMAPRRPTNWGRVGFVTAGMPASFTTGKCLLQACHLIFTNANVEKLVGSQVTWVFDNLAGYLNIGDRGMLSTMRQLRREALSPGVAHQSMIEALGEVIVIDLYRRFASHGHRASERGSKLASWQSRRIDEYVHAHLADGPVPVTRLAELCGVSASHLSRSFKNTEGITLQNYVETARISRARILLGDHRLTLAQVASACGYAHQGNFSTTFRRALRVTPSSFRRQEYGRSR